MSGGSPARRVYDLSDLSSAFYVRWLRPKWLMNVVAIGIAIAAAIFFLVYAGYDVLAGRFAGHGDADLVLAAFFLVFAYLFYFVGNARNRRPARAIELREDSLVIVYGSRRFLALRWDDPAFYLRIGRFNSNTLGRSVAYSQFWWHPRAFMTDEASLAISNEARVRGFKVECVKDPNSDSGESVVIRKLATYKSTSE